MQVTRTTPARLIRSLAFAFLLTLSALAPSQAPSRPSALVREVALLLSQHGLDKKTLRERADHIARTYAGELTGVGSKVATLQKEMDTRFGSMGWKERGQLISELWRVRSNINLMCLLSPSVLKEVTGFDVPGLSGLTTRMDAINSALKKFLAARTFRMAG